MALLKIYRLAYMFNVSDLENVKFSEWVRVEDMEAMEDKVNALKAKAAIPVGEVPEGVSPILLGWEEKALDTDPN